MHDLDSDTEQKSLSLFGEHMAYLEAERAIDAEENRRIDEFSRLPAGKLKLARRTRGPWTPAIGVMILAAACFLGYIFQPGEQKDLVAKGGAKVFVLVETSDDVRLLGDVNDLPEGTKVSAEIQASEDTLSFLTIFDRQGKALLDPSLVSTNMLEVPAGTRAHFDTAVELVGASEGESLYVIACQAAAFQKADANPLDFAKSYLSQLKTLDSLPEYCGLKRVQLRK